MDPQDGVPLETLPPAGENSTQAAADPLLDFGTIDTQYANNKAKTDPEGYGREPWRFMDGISYQGDIANAYLSIRVDKRDKFRENLNEKGRSKVDHENERIRKTRARFETYEDKKTMLAALRKAQREWRREVAETLPARHEVVKTYTTPGRQRYTALLQRLQSHSQVWLQADGAETDSPSQGAPGVPPGGGHDPLGPDCGFKAGAMYFRPGPDGVSWEGCGSNHTWFGGSKFPNQKIPAHKLLEKHADNPLTEREDEIGRAHV